MKVHFIDDKFYNIERVCNVQIRISKGTMWNLQIVRPSNSYTRIQTFSMQKQETESERKKISQPRERKPRREARRRGKAKKEETLTCYPHRCRSLAVVQKPSSREKRRQEKS